MITADQLVAHAVGDYLLQSDWMAGEKTKKSLAAAAHVLTYALPFLFLTRSIPALVWIVGTHFIIDRWRLARYVVWAKNFLAPAGKRTPAWSVCQKTGYPPDRPDWLVTWLMIIADNILHVVINAFALHCLT